MSGTGWINGVAVIVMALLLCRLDYVDGQLETERAAHRAMVIERDRWKTAAEACRLDAEAQAENARQCLARERQAQNDAAEREAIVRRAQPRVRTDDERNKVVDNETRCRAVARLNRPL